MAGIITAAIVGGWRNRK
ncbi:type I toxin-antitoxin system toxin Ldr family protein [Escherichia coli]